MVDKNFKPKIMLLCWLKSELMSQNRMFKKRKRNIFGLFWAIKSNKSPNWAKYLMISNIFHVYYAVFIKWGNFNIYRMIQLGIIKSNYWIQYFRFYKEIVNFKVNFLTYCRGDRRPPGITGTSKMCSLKFYQVI